MRIAVLITCHNRRASTLSCLQRLFEQALPPDAALAVYLVDDGSTDGTADAVRAAYPSVHIIGGDGTLFWCDGMRLAWKYASQSDPDAYFWVNDDTVLYPGALAALLATAAGAAARSCIVVGSCRDADTGRHTYGGEMVRSAHPGRCVPLMPAESEPKSCDTFNGNCVLVTREAFRRIGLMRSFGHSIGDTDYGLMATRLGIPVYLAPGYLATCSRNPITEAWRDRRLPRAERLRILVSRKGLPPADWWKFLWAHAGLRAFLYWPVPYMRVLSGL